MTHEHPDREPQNRSLRLLLPALAKWQRKLEQSLEERETTWHRLAVKVDRGRVIGCHLNTEEQVTIDDATDDA